MTRPGDPVRLELGGELGELVLDASAAEGEVLDEACIDALDRALEELGGGPPPRALLVHSRDPEVFVAGTDLDALRTLDAPALVTATAARVQQLFSRLGQLPFPVVAAIQGSCLGAGLELALACRLRLVADSPATRLGLPELHLGLIPGFGATQRLPRLIGLRRALEMLLTGRCLGWREAVDCGLADDWLPHQDFIERARQHTLAWLARRRRPRRPSVPLADRLLLGLGPARDVYLVLKERATLRRVGSEYPAPAAVFQVLREGLRRPLSEGLEIEASALGELATGAVCKRLLRLRLLGERARRHPLLVRDSVPRRRIDSVGVVGAGVIGAGVSLELVRHGLSVRLRDLVPEALQSALRQIDAGLVRLERGGELSALERRRALARLSPTTEASGFARADLVIEAVAESAEVKREVFTDLDVRCQPETILASNTSALPIAMLARATQRPQQVLGLHFFNPVEQLRLVEVVVGERCSDRSLASVLGLLQTLDKLPLLVADRPGFLVNRILLPYLLEAVLLCEQGQSVASIERALRDFGMTMGPLEQLDQIGLDVAQQVAGVLQQAFEDRVPRCQLLPALVGKGRLGAKTGRGFYRYAGRKRPDTLGLRLLGSRRGRGRKQLGDDEIQQRLLLAMVNEAARCLEERVVELAGEIDLASVQVLGFPSFRGGLLCWADGQGLRELHRRLDRLREVEGPRYAPAPLLSRLAAEGTRFGQLDEL